MSNPNPNQTSVDTLTVEVAETAAGIDSAVVFINGVSDLVKKAVADALAANPGTDLSALDELSRTLDKGQTDLANAVMLQGGVALKAPQLSRQGSNDSREDAVHSRKVQEASDTEQERLGRVAAREQGLPGVSGQGVGSQSSKAARSGEAIPGTQRTGSDPQSDRHGQADQAGHAADRSTPKRPS